MPIHRIGHIPKNYIVNETQKKHKMKYILKMASMLLFASFFLGACSEDDIAPDQAQAPVVTKSATDIKNIVYVEVNDVNPLNAGSYTLKNSGKAYFDYVLIFAANIRGVDGKATLFNNSNVQAVLSGKAKYIKPLQDKGIKVLLSVLGDHTGLGVANMTDAQVEDFATQLATAVITYGLDGIDFDDEWAEYGKNGYPSSSTGSYAKLITKLRAKMGTDKIITVFHFGYSGELSTVADKINYGMYPYFGGYGGPYMGLPNNKWAAYAINLNSYNNPNDIADYARKTVADGMGAICYYDLRTTNVLSTLNIISRICFGDVAVYDGSSYSKDW